VVTGGTVAINSTMISLGSSTNQSYINLAQGNFSTASSWVSTLNTASTIKFVSMSGNAQTQLAVSQVSTISSLYYTSTLGQSWAVLSGASGLPTATQTNYSAGAVSGDGRIVAIAANGGYLYTSNNSGASFTNTNPNTPIAYYQFENTINATIGPNLIASGSGGAPSYVTGIVGSKAVYLENTSPGTTTIPYYLRATLTGITNAITISLWFNLQQYSSAPQVIFSTADVFIVIYINGNSNTLGFNITGTPGITSTFAITLNTWYNVTAIAQSNNTCYLYINNALIGTYTLATTLASVSTISVGTYDNTLNYAFKGYIDDFKIYNSAITFTPMIPANWNNVALSNSGTYMLTTVANGGLFMSSNSGSTWSQVTSELLAANWSSLAISATGQYMLAYSAPVVVQPQVNGLASSTWQVNGVTWMASASSTGQSPSYVLFDTLIDQYWTSAQTNLYNGSGVYVGTTSTYVNGSGSVRGEWIQIQSSVPIQMYSYTLNAGSYTQYPNGLTVAGSNDDSNWYLLQSVTMSGNPIGTAGAATSTSYIIVNQSGAQTMTTTGGSATFTCTTSAYSANPYTYFRLIFPASFGSSGFIALTEWLIRFNAGGQAYSTNFGSTWQNGYALATPSALSLSGSGQYAIGANAVVSQYTIVNNYLSGFGTGTATTGAVTGTITASAVSTTGQYMAIVTTNTSSPNVYYSSNYGSTFTGLTIGSTPMTTCAISADGSYITVSNGTTVYQLNNNSNGFSLALGNQAGQQNQGQNAIAIGNFAGQINQSANSIILNASGSVINPVAQGFYVAPIAQYGSSTSSLSLLAYGMDNQVVQTFSLLSLSAGNVGIGTTAPVGALSLQLDGNGNYNPAMWTSSYALFGTGVGSTIGSAVAITYNSVGNYGALLSLSPNIAWRPMYYSALSHTFMYGPGNATFGMIIASGGNVGIGTQSPTSILTLNNNSAAFTSQLLLKGKDYYTGTTGTSGTGIAINLGVNNINNKQLYLTDPDLAINTTNPLLNFTVGGDKCYIRGLSTDGTTALPVYMGSSLLSAGDGTTNLGASGYRFGAVFAVNGTIQTSDSSEKDLTILPYGLTELMQMKTIMYKWKSQAFLPDTDPAKNYQYYGVCADQLSAIFPELVYNEDPSVPMQLNYSEIIPVVVKAMQEQNVSIQEQSTKIQQQATQIQKQATEITALQLTVASQSTQVLQAQLTAQQIQIAQLMQRLSAAGIA
jgi:hypothetical protein